MKNKTKQTKEPKVLEAFALTEQETKSECEEIAWQMFCAAHPVEAFRHDPDGFWKYFHAVAPTVTRERMEQIVKECEETPD